MVNIYTIADKRPDFIEMQLRSFKAFVKDEFTFIVFNNSISETFTDIENECHRLGLQCVTVQNPDHSTANYACSYPFQQIINRRVKPDNDNVSVIIDSDMVLLGATSFSSMIDGFDIAGVAQQRKHVDYIWNGIVVFNPLMPDKDELDMQCNHIDCVPVDVGGNFYYYHQKHPECKIRYLPTTSVISSQNGNLDCLPEVASEGYEDEFQSEVVNFNILHYRCGSNWDLKSKSHHTIKTNWFLKTLNKAICTSQSA